MRTHDGGSSTAAQGFETRFRSPFMGACLGCFGGTVFLGLVIVGCLSFSAGRFVRFGMSEDLTGFRQQIAAMEMAQERRDSLLERIDAVREGVRTGAPRPGMLEWIERSDAIQGLLEDGELSERDFEQLVRDLDWLECVERR